MLLGPHLPPHAPSGQHPHPPRRGRTHPTRVTKVIRGVRSRVRVRGGVWVIWIWLSMTKMGVYVKGVWVS